MIDKAGREWELGSVIQDHWYRIEPIDISGQRMAVSLHAFQDTDDESVYWSRVVVNDLPQQNFVKFFEQPWDDLETAMEKLYEWWDNNCNSLHAMLVKDAATLVSQEETMGVV